eukprot:2252449-Prymnesium_polylepis.1
MAPRARPTHTAHNSHAHLPCRHPSHAHLPCRHPSHAHLWCHAHPPRVARLFAGFPRLHPSARALLLLRLRPLLLRRLSALAQAARTAAATPAAGRR